jgi:hypothetical protein
MLGVLAIIAGVGLAVFGLAGFMFIGIPVDNPVPSILGYSACVGFGPAIMWWGERN